MLPPSNQYLPSRCDWSVKLNAIFLVSCTSAKARSLWNKSHHGEFAEIGLSTGPPSRDLVGAVSEAVKQACRDDYMSLCSQHEIGCQALRSCMRSTKSNCPEIARLLSPSLVKRPSLISSSTNARRGRPQIGNSR